MSWLDFQRVLKTFGIFLRKKLKTPRYATRAPLILICSGPVARSVAEYKHSLFPYLSSRPLKISALLLVSEKS